MNILLVYPRFRYNSMVTIEEPLGILYIAASLREAGHKVRVKDLTFEKELNILDEDIRHAHVVGFSAPTQLFGIALDILKYVKTENPHVVSIIGGPHATADLKNALQADFDIAVLGEGEETIKDLVTALENEKPLDNISGIAFKTNGEIKINTPRPFMQNLDNIPFPARDLIDYTNYRRVGLMSMRGCPYKCFFCKPLVDNLFGKKLRKRSPENIAAETEEIVHRYGNRIISFKDDTLTINNVEWFKQLQEEFERRKLNIKWQCNSRVDTVNYDKLRAMKDSGCQQIFFGIESGSQKILDFYKKGIAVEQTIEAFKLCKKVKINACASIMLGAPMETRDDLEETYQLVKIIEPYNWHVHVTTPNPGSDLWSYAQNKSIMNKIAGYNGFEQTANIYNLNLPLKLDYLTKDDIREYRSKINRYMKARVLVNSVVSPSMWAELLTSRGLRIVAANFIRRHFNPFGYRQQ